MQKSRVTHMCTLAEGEGQQGPTKSAVQAVKVLCIFFNMTLDVAGLCAFIWCCMRCNKSEQVPRVPQVTVATYAPSTSAASTEENVWHTCMLNFWVTALKSRYNNSELFYLWQRISPAMGGAMHSSATQVYSTSHRRDVSKRTILLAWYVSEALHKF